MTDKEMLGDRYVLHASNLYPANDRRDAIHKTHGMLLRQQGNQPSAFICKNFCAHRGVSFNQRVQGIQARRVTTLSGTGVCDFFKLAKAPGPRAGRSDMMLMTARLKTVATAGSTLDFVERSGA
jgi:hypothetical protein